MVRASAPSFAAPLALAAGPAAVSAARARVPAGLRLTTTADRRFPAPLHPSRPAPTPAQAVARAAARPAPRAQAQLLAPLEREPPAPPRRPRNHHRSTAPGS